MGKRPSPHAGPGWLESLFIGVYWYLRGEVCPLCEKPGHTGGQIATLDGQILALVSCPISASCTTHIGPPPYPLHTPSTHPRLGMAGWAGDSQYSEWSQRRLVTTIDRKSTRLNS